MRVAVVGHVEWCEFAEVAARAAAGRDRPRRRDLRGAGRRRGGGRGAAAQARRCGHALHGVRRRRDRTPLDARAARARLRVEGRFRPEPQRRAFVHLTEGERTITVLGPRLGPSGADDRCRGELLDETDAVYLTAGDAEAVRQARRAARRWSPRRAGSRPWPRRTWSSTRSCRAARDAGRALQPRATSIRRRAWSCARAGADGGEWETAERRARPLGPGRAARPGPRRLRRRRQLRRRPHLRARRGLGRGEGGRAGGPLRRGLPHGPRPVRGAAGRLA